MTIIPRMSFIGTTHAAQSRLAAASARMERANEKVSTGRAYTRPSDNPTAASRGAVLRDQIELLDVYSTNISDARSRLSIADTKLQQSMDLYHRITELTTQAASSTSSGPARLAVREEVLQIRKELENVANTQYLGAPLFAGFGPGPAVVPSGPGWAFNGNPADQVDRVVGAGETVSTSITAQELFSAPSGDVFSTLDNLAAALQANDTAAIQATIDPMKALRSTLSAGQSRIGAAVNRVEAAESRNSAIRITLSTERSQVEDVDLNDAITEQSRLALAYQAALGVTAKANQQTLLDYWR
jgi:flagellar hook-associated protein 3 FlgL